ncbi:GIY-YIG nuclease family protein [Vibrio owensii]|uniref:Bacteriophage T5 Orf172 DNA-binding domain-containing protein n=1 Tax=Vibrio owensii CAIM 1854 = LMG 25443 TaxID=1229493 RepID=A0A0C1VS50_9VIBR|nr:GIY-YIG nuclease family protein [Vibrio owensii]KIF46827.1 hypothetical protein H735_28555 [Vibrio owensii CAIM 1854 = LMG 25443]
MDNGFIYIMTNSAMPDLIKIGMTARDSRERARELSNTSVPLPFKVAFEIYCNDIRKVESAIHRELADFRVNPNREFFRYPLDKAINLIQESIGENRDSERFQAVDIMEDLVKKYPDHLKTDIVSVRIVQPKERVWLEISTEKISRDGELVDQTIRREDLAFICNEDPDDLFFKPEDDVRINAYKFVEEYDPFSIIMTTDLFREEVCEEINEKHNPCYAKNG